MVLDTLPTHTHLLPTNLIVLYDYYYYFGMGGGGGGKKKCSVVSFA